jgi:hypothetical protein
LEEGEFEKFLTYYLKEYHKIMCEKEPEFEYWDDQKSFIVKELPILKDQAQRCILMSHLQWAFWSLIMMPIEDLEKCEAFYMEYAVARL